MRASLSVLVGLVFVVGCNVPPGENPPPRSDDPEAARLDYPRWETQEPGDHLAYNRRVNIVQRGREVYGKYCVGCHGDAGDGRGTAATRLITQPRDFTSGIYKFRSTDSGSLPMETDLYRTLQRGLYGVSMPAFPLMPHRDKVAVIEYIKTFYPRWESEKDGRVIVPVPKAPQDLADVRRIARGRIAYLAMQCSQCHGVDGQGTGATRTEYVDAWGHPQKPFNFTRGSLKGGNSAEDIYRTFHTGLRSIMPAYGGDTLAGVVRATFPPGEGLLDDAEVERLSAVLGDFPETIDEVTGMDSGARAELATRNSWDLVAYIISLRQTTTTARAVLGEAAVQARSANR